MLVGGIPGRGAEREQQRRHATAVVAQRQRRGHHGQRVCARPVPDDVRHAQGRSLGGGRWDRASHTPSRLRHRSLGAAPGRESLQVRAEAGCEGLEAGRRPLRIRGRALANQACQLVRVVGVAAPVAPKLPHVRCAGRERVLGLGCTATGREAGRRTQTGPHVAPQRGAPLVGSHRAPDVQAAEAGEGQVRPRVRVGRVRPGSALKGALRSRRVAPVGVGEAQVVPRRRHRRVEPGRGDGGIPR